MRKGKLPPKVREMIVVAAVSIGGYLPGIKDHVRRALRLGATKEELVEVFQSAYFHTGALTLVHGMVDTKLLAALFEGTPYARDALGTKASFDRTTGAMLKTDLNRRERNTPHLTLDARDRARRRTPTDGAAA